VPGREVDSPPGRELLRVITSHGPFRESHSHPENQEGRRKRLARRPRMRRCLLNILDRLSARGRSTVHRLGRKQSNVCLRGWKGGPASSCFSGCSLLDANIWIRALRLRFRLRCVRGPPCGMAKRMAGLPHWRLSEWPWRRHFWLLTLSRMC